MDVNPDDGKPYNSPEVAGGGAVDAVPGNRSNKVDGSVIYTICQQYYFGRENLKLLDCEYRLFALFN